MSALGRLEGKGRRRSARSRSEWLRKLEQGLLWSLVWGSALLLGGVLPSAIGALGALALGTLLLRIKNGHRLAGWPVAILGGLSLYSALQCVKIPLAWLRVLDADIADTWARAQALRAAPAWGALSLDPEATRLEVLEGLVLLVVWAAAFTFRRQSGLTAALRGILGLALTVAAVTALHRVLGLERVYGLYAPLYSAHVGPVLNPNAMSALLNLGTFAGLALILHERSSKAQVWVLSLCVAISMATNLLVASRAGVASLLGGTLVLAAFYTRAVFFDRQESNRVERALPLVLAVVFAAALFVLSFDDIVEAALSDASVDKLELWRWGVRVWLEHPWWGVGRGALSSELGRVGVGSERAIYSHVESWPLEWLAGWGAFGWVAILALGWVCWPRWGAKRLPELSVWLGLCAVVVQNLVDLGLETLGLAVPFTFTAAALLAGRAEERPARRSVPWRDGLIVFGLGLGLGWLSLNPVHLAHHERQRLGARFQTGELPSKQELEDALGRHPGDAYLLILGAQRAVLHEPQRSLAWTNAALVQAPRSARAHVVAAHSLHRLGRTEQALLMLRIAAELGPELHPEIAALARAWSPDEVDAVVPDGPSAATLLLQLALREKDARRALSLLDAARARQPGLRALRQATAELYLQAWQERVAPCDEQPTHCLARADQEIGALESAAENSPAALDLRDTVLRARWYLASDQPERAYELLDRGCPRALAALPCLELWLDSAARLSGGQLVDAADGYTGIRCRDSGSCALAELRVSGLFRARGDLHVALEHALHAAEHDAGWTAWATASELALELGRFGQARLLAERARRVGGNDPAVAARVESLLTRLPPPN